MYAHDNNISIMIKLTKTPDVGLTDNYLSVN